MHLQWKRLALYSGEWLEALLQRKLVPMEQMKQVRRDSPWPYEQVEEVVLRVVTAKQADCN